MIKYYFDYYKKTDGREEPVRLDHCALPFKNRVTLDETLDMSVFDVVGTEIAAPFSPFTKMRVTIENTDTQAVTTLYRYVASDDVEQIAFNKPYLYTHTLTLVEPTKILEREICDNLTFTNTLLAQEAETPREIEASTWFSDKSFNPPSGDLNYPAAVRYTYQQSGRFQSSYVSGAELTLIPLNVELKIILQESPTLVTEKWQPANEAVHVTVTGPNGAETYTPGSTIILRTGNYTVEYTGKRYGSVPDGAIIGNGSWRITFSFYVFDRQNRPKRKSVTKALNRLLAVTPLRREGVSAPKYQLTPECAARYSGKECPEMVITGKNLFEALIAFGGHLHAIPYLKVTEGDWRSIDFMELGKKTPAEIKCLHSGYTATTDIGDFCTSLDTLVENVMDTDDEAQGTITEPCAGAYITPRVEVGEIEIGEKGAFIPTQEPIYKITDLEVGLVGEKYPDQGFESIKRSVLEKSEYELKSAYEEGEDSKSMYLNYTQGKNNIYGLTFKREGLTGGAFENYAVINILTKKCMLNASNADLPNLQFRIKYIPYVTMRVKQYKADWDAGEESTILYNQQANVVDSKAYGEHLKGLVARVGNPERKKTYYFKSFEEVPEIGTTEGNYYIAATDAECWGKYVKCTVTFSKDFNKLSEYIGIKNEQRYYEVSDRMAQNRHMNYSEFCVIGDPLKQPGDTVSVMPLGKRAFLQTFLQNDTSVTSVTCAQVTGTAEGKELTSVLLPVTGHAEGNSIGIKFRFLDNYAAGYQSVPDAPGRKTRIQKAVPYGDEFGKLDALKVTLAQKAGSMSQEGSTAAAYALPERGNVNVTGVYFDLTDKPLIVQKDSREILDLTYQVHFRRNRSELIPGIGLTQNNPIVRGISKQRLAKIFLLCYNIGEFDSKVDLTDAVRLQADLATLFQETDNGFVFHGFDSPANCQSWAFVSDEDTLVLGVNEPLQKGGQAKEIYFHFTDRPGVR